MLQTNYIKQYLSTKYTARKNIGSTIIYVVIEDSRYSSSVIIGQFKSLYLP